MSTGIHVPTKRELELSKELRSLALAAISKQRAEVVAEVLDLKPTGLDNLLHASQWDLRTAFRVADVLDLDIFTAIRAVVAANTTKAETLEQAG